MNWTTAQLNLAKCKVLRWLQRRGVTAGCPEPSRSSPTAKPMCWKLKMRSMQKSGCSASMWLWRRPKNVRTARPQHTCDACSAEDPVGLSSQMGVSYYQVFFLFHYDSLLTSETNVLSQMPPSTFAVILHINSCNGKPLRLSVGPLLRWAWQRASRAHCGQKGSLRRTLMNHDQ